MYGDEDEQRLAVIDRAGLPSMVRASTTADDYRPKFARDYDRIVHTSAFRRLQGKTQVVTPGQADFFRTRLTHTIEVAQIARRLSYKLGTTAGLPSGEVMQLSEVCEAAAALHDLGHPPFGHIGEDALSEALDSYTQESGWQAAALNVGGFEGNAQNFRLAVWALSHADSRGLGLTRAVLDASIKYTSKPFRTELDRQKQPKWNCYPTELWAYDWLRSPVPEDLKFEKSFEAQIMDWSDDIAYATHDLEDWCRAGYMPIAMLVQSQATRRHLVQDLTLRAKTRKRPESEAALTAAVKHLFAAEGPFGFFRGLGTEYDGSLEAKRAVMHMRKTLFDDFIDAASIELRHGAAKPARYGASLRIDPQAKMRNHVIKELLWVYVIEHPRMATHQAGQKRIVGELTKIYAGTIHSSSSDALHMLPRDARERIRNLKGQSDRAKTDAEALRLVADHVGGMTDSYAAMIHRRLTGQVSGEFNSFV